MNTESDWDEILAKLSAPARRALLSNGIHSLIDLSQHSKREVSAWHGIGPSALRLIEPFLMNDYALVGAKELPRPIQDYFDSKTGIQRKRLEEMRSLIKPLAAGAEELMKYGLPTFYLHGNLVHYAVYENHTGFYPAPSAIVAFRNKLNDYHTSKGAIQFPHDRSLPATLIRNMVKYRIRENLLKYKKKKPGS